MYKFKGKSIEKNEYIYGSLLTINDKYYIYPHDYGDLSDIDFGYAFEEVYKDSVVPLVGFDSDNNEVYPGDYLHKESYDSWVIQNNFKIEIKNSMNINSSNHLFIDVEDLKYRKK